MRSQHAILSLGVNKYIISTKYFILSKVYTDEGSIKYLYHGLSAVRKIIHELAYLVDYLTYSRTGRDTTN